MTKQNNSTQSGVLGGMGLRIFCEGKQVTFAYPPFDSGSYREVYKKILDHNQAIPNGDNIISLIYASFLENSFKDKLEFKNFRSILREGVYIPNINVLSEEGVYVIHDNLGSGPESKYNIAELKRKLKCGIVKKGVRFSRDGKIRFAPRASCHFSQTNESLSSNGFFIANFGVEGAKKLKKLSETFYYKPELPSLGWLRRRHYSGLVGLTLQVSQPQVEAPKIIGLDFFGNHTDRNYHLDCSHDWWKGYGSGHICFGAHGLGLVRKNSLFGDANEFNLGCEKARQRDKEHIKWMFSENSGNDLSLSSHDSSGYDEFGHSIYS